MVTLAMATQKNSWVVLVSAVFDIFGGVGGDSEQSVYDTDGQMDGNLSESRIGFRYRRYSSFQRCSVCVPSTVIVKYSCL